MKKVICLSLAMVFLFTCTMVAFADVELLPSGVVSWSDVGNDGLALAEAYMKMLNSTSGKEFFKNATDIPISWLQLMSDGSWCLSPVDDYFYFLKDGFLKMGDNSGHGGGGGASRDVTAPEDFHLPSGVFNTFLEEQNQTNIPKSKDMFKCSYRNNNYINSSFSSNWLPLFNNAELTEPFSDLYLIPFYLSEDGVLYTSNYQIHLYYTSNDDPNSDVCIKYDLYQYYPQHGYVILPEYSRIVYEFTSYTYPYTVALSYYLYGATLAVFNSESSYLNFVRDTDRLLNLPSDAHYISSDDGTSFRLDVQHVPSGFFKPYKDNPNTKDDIGFFASESLMSRVYDIDTTKIPANQVITITGDSIYDYSITNPDTGETTTINNYITNNYTYLAEPTTSGGGSGGVGGDINVGGNITVGGQVGFDVTVSVPDININVNQNGGAGENGGENVGDYIDTSGDVDVGGIIGKLPQLSKGFTDYLRGFFVWLPPEIYALIILILVISVWNVFRSRR